MLSSALQSNRDPVQMMLWMQGRHREQKNEICILLHAVTITVVYLQRAATSHPSLATPAACQASTLLL